MKGASHRSLYHHNSSIPELGKFVLPAGYSTAYYLFQTAETPEKVNIKRKDIMHIITGEDAKNKIALMRDGIQHTFIKYSMFELSYILPHLLQPNQSELVAMEIIASKGKEHIHLTILNKDGKQKMVIIGRAYRKSFDLQFNQMQYFPPNRSFIP